MTLSFSSCMHIQIKWVTLWLSVQPSPKQLSYLPIKRFKISSVMSCPSFSRIKTRAVTASTMSRAQGLPAVWWADAGMIMPSPGLMSQSKSSPEHTTQIGLGFFVLKRNPNSKCSDLFGLRICISKLTKCGWVALLTQWTLLLYSFKMLWYFFLLKDYFCYALIPPLCSISPQRDATLSDGCFLFFQSQCRELSSIVFMIKMKIYLKQIISILINIIFITQVFPLFSCNSPPESVNGSLHHPPSCV